MKEYLNEINDLFTKYKIDDEEQKEFMNIITPIVKHPEFLRRMDNKIFPHHANVSLGNHIISDAMITYIKAKRKIKRGKKIDLNCAVIIAMFHDLYELPWQNAGIEKNMFINKHGFTHPLEAAINASIWFPKYFEDNKKAEIIIDGIIHHMWPFPVRAIDKTFEDTELNNLEKLDKVNKKIKSLIINSSKRNNIFHLSFSRSRSLEGRIMSSADKKVSMSKDIKSFNSLKALVTGINPDLDNYKKNKKEKC